MASNDTIHVLYNACNGEGHGEGHREGHGEGHEEGHGEGHRKGWRPSIKAIQLYNQRTFAPKNGLGIYSCCRHDPILLNIYYELGEDFDGQNSVTKAKVIPRKYANHYYITKNNGLETVNVEINQSYVKDELYKILKSTMTNDEKINELNKLYLID